MVGSARLGPAPLTPFVATAAGTQGVLATKLVTYPAPRQFAVGAFTAAGRAWLFAPSLGASFSKLRSQQRSREFCSRLLFLRAERRAGGFTSSGDDFLNRQRSIYWETPGDRTSF
uniref:Uncharacterized protein n=1 Tax=Papio anubis TaxID=9555 RepID=A0A8I5NFF9_PAPAN